MKPRQRKNQQLICFGGWAIRLDKHTNIYNTSIDNVTRDECERLLFKQAALALSMSRKLRFANKIQSIHFYARESKFQTNSIVVAWSLCPSVCVFSSICVSVVEMHRIVHGHQI